MGTSKNSIIDRISLKKWIYYDRPEEFTALKVFFVSNSRPISTAGARLPPILPRSPSLWNDPDCKPGCEVRSSCVLGVCRCITSTFLQTVFVVRTPVRYEHEWWTSYDSLPWSDRPRDDSGSLCDEHGPVDFSSPVDRLLCYCDKRCRRRRICCCSSRLSLIAVPSFGCHVPPHQWLS